jgi:hypothetical protein
LDWRYYVTSLVAVFLALTAGIVIGSALIGEKAVIKQQSTMLSRLEGDLSSLKETNFRLRQALDAAQEELAAARASLKYSLPVLARNTLQGRRVAIVASEGSPTDRVEELLGRSAAQVVSVTEIAWSRFPWEGAIGLLGLREGSHAEIARRLGVSLGEALAGAGEAPNDLIEPGIREGWLRRKGEYGSKEAALLILLSGKQEGAPALTALSSLAAYWRENCGPVVAAAPDEAMLKPFQQLRAATVEDAEAPWSQAALVAALAAPEDMAPR